MEGWLRPGLILGAVALLILANALEFRARRKREEAALARLPDSGTRADWLAERSYTTQRAIEQLMHLCVTLLVALLIAVLTA